MNPALWYKFLKYKPLISCNNWRMLTFIIDGSKFIKNYGKSKINLALHSGLGIYLNGQNQHIELAKHGSIDNTTTVTYSIFAKPSSLVDVSKVTFMCEKRYAWLHVGTNGFNITTYDGTNFISDFVPRDNTLGVVCNFVVSPTSVKVYSDTKLVFTKNVVALYSEGYWIRLGSRENERYWDGIINNFSMIIGELNSQQISDNYNNPEEFLFYDGVNTQSKSSIDTSKVISFIPMSDKNSDVRDYAGGSVTSFTVDNFTSSVKDNAKNLIESRQTIYEKSDSLGLILNTIFGRFHGDLIGYADSNYIPNITQDFQIESVFDSDANGHVFGSNNVVSADKVRIVCIGTTSAYISFFNGMSFLYDFGSIGKHHAILEFKRATNTANFYHNGVLKQTNTITPVVLENTLVVGGKHYSNSGGSQVNEVYDGEITLWDTHIVLQNPLNLFNKATNKGKLL